MPSTKTPKIIDICQQHRPCPHIEGRRCNTVECANCKYNHVVSYSSFKNQVSPTAGTICCFNNPNARNL